VITLLGAVFGCLLCFYGERLLRLLLGLVGMAVGGYLGWLAAHQAWAGHGLPANLLAGCLAIVGAVFGLVVCAVFYYLGMFVLGALTGVLLAQLLGRFSSPGLRPTWALALALTGAVLAVVFHRRFAAGATACIGSWMIVSAMAWFFEPGFIRSVLAAQTHARYVSDARYWLLLVGWVAVAVVGYLIQTKSATRAAGLRLGTLGAQEWHASGATLPWR